MRRVDNIPLYLKPFFWLYGYGFGVLLYLFSRLNALTCRFHFTGEKLPANTPAVYIIWHTDLVLYFSAFSKVQKQAWLNHPLWYMKPVHVLLHLTGVEHICLGSSGNSGKEALANVIEYLKQGYSTCVAVDGPAGPAYAIKPGALLMSRDAAIPVVALRFKGSKGFKLNGWDTKFVPLPFSQITVEASRPVWVTEENFIEAEDTPFKSHSVVSKPISPLSCFAFRHLRF
jgi:lysophospholipid acyltransferase (LPLAT)-like uncharacterized protein